MNEKIRTATVRDIDQYLSDDVEVCAWEDVDKVIAEKDKEITDLIEKNKRLARKDLIMASETIKDVFKELSHHKYKRCLALYLRCKDNAAWWDYEQINRLNEQRGNDKSLRFKEAHAKFCHYVKWEQRWLELADKFKEA